jgi:hypothetical protein
MATTQSVRSELDLPTSVIGQLKVHGWTGKAFCAALGLGAGFSAPVIGIIPRRHGLVHRSGVAWVQTQAR